MIDRHLAGRCPSIRDRVIDQGFFGKAGVVVAQIFYLVPQTSISATQHEQVALSETATGARHHRPGYIGSLSPLAGRGNELPDVVKNFGSSPC